MAVVALVAVPLRSSAVPMAVPLITSMKRQTTGRSCHSVASSIPDEGTLGSE